MDGSTVTATEVEHVKGHVMTTIAPARDDHDNVAGPSSHTDSHAETASTGTPSITSSSSEIDYPSGTKFWLIILTTGCVIVLFSIDMNVVATAVPSITDHFHTVADVGWYSSAFRLCYCAFQFIYGRAYKVFSTKRVYLIANVISLVGSLLCGAATSSTMLVIGRAVAGLGSAGLLSGTFNIIAQSMTLQRRAAYSGMFNAVEGLSVLCAPLLGGVITQSLGWRWVFYINLPFGAVTIPLMIFCLSDPPKSREVARMTLKEKILQIDLVSNLLFIPGMTAVFLALSWAGTKYPWSSGAVIGPFVVFAVLMAAFIVLQWRLGDRAAIPLRILKRRSVFAGSLFILFANSAEQVLEYYLPTYFQVVRGYSPAKSGYLLIPLIITATIGAVVQGIGTSASGQYVPFMLFASILFPISTGLVTTFKVDTGLAQLITYTALSGLAYGIGVGGPSIGIQTVLAKEDLPLGIAIAMFANSFGPAVAVAIAQVLFTNELQHNLDGLAPHLDGATIENLGLTQIVQSVPISRLKEAIEGVDISIIQTWYLVVGLACATVVGSLLMEWRSVKTRRD